MDYEIKRIPILPLIKVLFFVFLVIGFIWGIFYGLIIIGFVSVMSSVLNLNDSITEQFAGMGFLGVIFMGIFFSIFSAVLMTVFSAVGAACYNLIAGWLGGVTLQLEAPEDNPYALRPSRENGLDE